MKKIWGVWVVVGLISIVLGSFFAYQFAIFYEGCRPHKPCPRVVNCPVPQQGSGTFDRPTPGGDNFKKPNSPFLDWALQPALTDGFRSKPCSIADFETEWFKHYYEEVIKNACGGPSSKLHRKDWEIVYMSYVISEHVDCSKGARGLVVAAGKEITVSYFASKGCSILATDMEPEGAANQGWTTTNQFAGNVENLYLGGCPSSIPLELFKERVSFRTMNMNFLPEDLMTPAQQFDFIWSLCSVEHVGSIELGQRFIINQMDLLKPGGIAFHTMEFTLSSNGDTVNGGVTVLWRRRDVETVIHNLRLLGYEVFAETFNAGVEHLDTHPDVPPYKNHDHIKLLLMSHVVTSYAIIVKKPLDFNDPRRRTFN